MLCEDQFASCFIYCHSLHLHFTASGPEPTSKPTSKSTTDGDVPAPTGDKSSQQGPGFAVIGGAIGAVVLAIIAVATGLVLWRKRKHQGKGTVLNNDSNNLFGQCDHDIYLFVSPQFLFGSQRRFQSSYW